MLVRSYSLGLVLPAFCATLALTVLASPGQVPEPAAVIGRLAFLAGAAFAMAASARRWPATKPWLVALGSGVLLVSCYTTLARILPWVIPDARDWWLLRLDRVWLGYYWEEMWLGVQHPLLTDSLQTIYACFYFFPFLLGLSFALRRDWHGFYNGIDRIILGFVLSYCGYLIVPARSPYEFVEYAAALPSLGLRDAIHSRLLEASATRHDCFPSGHTMMSAYVAWLAWVRARPLFWILGPWALLTAVATLYLRYHYLIDVLAGLIAMLALIPLSNWIFGSFHRTEGLESRP